MRGIVHSAGSLLIIALLVAHFFLIALFITPSHKLLGLFMPAEAGFLQAEDLPKNVERFLVSNRVPVEGDYQAVSGGKAKLIFSILKLRREHFMEEPERIVLEMNLLNYGDGVIGLKAGARYFYKKSSEQLTDREWITLVHLERILSKK